MDWDKELRPGPLVYDYRGRARGTGSILMSDHAPPPVPIGNGVAGGPELVRDG